MDNEGNSWWNAPFLPAALPHLPPTVYNDSKGTDLPSLCPGGGSEEKTTYESQSWDNMQ